MDFPQSWHTNFVGIKETTVLSNTTFYQPREPKDILNLFDDVCNIYVYRYLYTFDKA